MNFTNPIPRTGLPHFSESSKLRSPRDSDAVPRVWQKALTEKNQTYRNSQAIEQIQRQLNRLRKRKGGDAVGERRPYELYAGSTWLKVLASSGYLITTGVAVESTAVDTELTLTSGLDECWVYLDIPTNTVTVSATLPTWDVDKFPLGWVDTTDTVNEIAEIHQFWDSNIYYPC